MGRKGKWNKFGFNSKIISIRIPDLIKEDEKRLKNFLDKKIENFLTGNTKEQDEIQYNVSPNKNGELLKLLKFLNSFFKDNVNYLAKNDKIKKFILNHKEFDRVEELT